MRPPILVFDISSGVRPPRRGLARLSQAKARSREPYPDSVCDSRRATQHAIRLIDGEFFATRSTMLQGSQGNNQRIDLRSRKPECDEAIDGRAGQLTLDEVQHLLLGLRSTDSQPLADLLMPD